MRMDVHHWRWHTAGDRLRCCGEDWRRQRWHTTPHLRSRSNLMAGLYRGAIALYSSSSALFYLKNRDVWRPLIFLTNEPQECIFDILNAFPACHDYRSPFAFRFLAIRQRLSCLQ